MMARVGEAVRRGAGVDLSSRSWAPSAHLVKNETGFTHSPPMNKPNQRSQTYHHLGGVFSGRETINAVPPLVSEGYFSGRHYVFLFLPLSLSGWNLLQMRLSAASFVPSPANFSLRPSQFNMAARAFKAVVAFPMGYSDVGPEILTVRARKGSKRANCRHVHFSHLSDWTTVFRTRPGNGFFRTRGCRNAFI